MTQGSKCEWGSVSGSFRGRLADQEVASLTFSPWASRLPQPSPGPTGKEKTPGRGASAKAPRLGVSRCDGAEKAGEEWGWEMKLERWVAGR